MATQTATSLLSNVAAVDGFVPVLIPATGERLRVRGYAVGTRTRTRRIALIRAMLTRAIDLGAVYPAETLERVMSNDDDADGLAQRYTGRVTGLTVESDGETWDYTHDMGCGGRYPLAQLVIL